MIGAVIIDDEQHSIDRLGLLLEELGDPAIRLEGAFRSVEEGLDGIRALKPGLVFLDVQLEDRTGFDLLQQLGEVPFEVIFTTAYEKYAVRAFKFSAIDYLLKPIVREDLRQALGRLKDRISRNDLNNRMEALFHNLRNLQGVPKKISIPTVNGLLFLEVSGIVRCQSDVNYTIIHLSDGQQITVAKTLKEFEELLEEHNFYRVHNSHLVNLAYIKSYNKGKGGWLTLSDGAQISVSTRRKEHFLKTLAGGNRSIF